MNASTEHLVGKISPVDFDTLAYFRHRASWQLRPDGAGAYWLRLPASDAADFQGLSLLGRWHLRGDGRLVRAGRDVPEAILPEDDWSALDNWLPLGPPSRGAAGMPPERLSIQLQPSIVEGPPAAALLCMLEDFHAWADTALAPRLARLKFACDGMRRIFVVGAPLPPVPGATYYAAGRTFLPSGWELPPHLLPEWISELLSLGSNRFAILHEDGSHEEISEENLIPATRQAIRATAAALASQTL